MSVLIQVARMLFMPRVRSFNSRARAALALLLAGVVMNACRPAADLGPPTPDLRLRLRTQPANARVGVPFGTVAVVEVIDPDDQLVSTANLSVRASVTAGGAQVSQGGVAPVVGGVATFSNLTLTGPAGSNVHLSFQLLKLDVADPDAILNVDVFELGAGPASSINAQTSTSVSGIPGQTVTPSPAVILRDISGNPVADVPVTFAVSLGEGRITGPADVKTNAQGVATIGGWILGLPGDNRLRAALGNQEITFSANVTSTTGMLRIRINGVPAGATAKVRVQKTSATGAVYDVIHDVRDSLTVTGLPFGTYQVSGDSVKVGSRIWQADGNAQGLNVASNSGPSTSLSYREYGRFEITARGLGSPTQTGILDFFPTAGESALLFNTTVTNDAVTRGLGAIGTYDVTPRTVNVGGQIFSAPKQSAVLLGGDALAQLTFNYTVTTGTLIVTLAGLPAGVSPQVDVTGPGGFHETVFMSGSRTWVGLAPGTYTVTASPITSSGTTFTPTPGTSQNAVTAGGSVTRTINYN